MIIIKHLPLLFLLGNPPLLPAQSAWHKPGPFPEARAPFESIHFTDPDTGFAVGGGRGILKTLDGGATWKSIAGAPAVALNGICFSGTRLGLVVGRRGLIYRTTDGGANWIHQDSVTAGNLVSVQCPSADTAFALTDFSAVSGAAELLRSLDGGRHWMKTALTANKFFKMRFYGSRMGFVIGGTFGADTIRMYKTLDGGQTWKGIPTKPALYSIHFLGPDTGFAAGAEPGPAGNVIPALYKSTDGGLSWTVILTHPPYRFTSVHFTSRRVGYAAGGDVQAGGCILKTTDGGATWSTQWEAEGAYVMDLHFAGVSAGFALGWDGSAGPAPYAGLFLKIAETAPAVLPLR